MCVCVCLGMCPGVFIDVDIEVLISEFVVVAILSQWWSVPTTADHIPVCVFRDVPRFFHWC